MPDPFCTLPMPLPLMIFEAIEDLSTLSYLLEASPSAAIIFGQRYCEITEALLDRLPLELQRLLRTIVALQSNRLAVRDQINSFADLTECRVPSIVRNIKATQLLTRATHSLAAVRSLISSAGRVQGLCQCFFDTFLARVNSIRPYRIANELYNYGDYPAELPERRPYRPLPCGPPSWIEEQRVLRALWRLQLYVCLVGIVKDGGGTEGIARKPFTPQTVWADENRWQIGELECVYEFIVEKDTSTARLSQLPCVASGLVTVPQRSPEDTETHIWWEQTPMGFRNWPSPGASHFLVIGNERNSPLRGISFKPFRRLGRGIWDRMKMVGLGLVNERHAAGLDCNEDAHAGTTSDTLSVRETITKDDLLCRWKSIEI